MSKQQRNATTNHSCLIVTQWTGNTESQMGLDWTPSQTCIWHVIINTDVPTQENIQSGAEKIEHTYCAKTFAQSQLLFASSHEAWSAENRIICIAILLKLNILCDVIAGSKPYTQRNSPVLNWRCRLTQADLCNGCKTGGLLGWFCGIIHSVLQAGIVLSLAIQTDKKWWRKGPSNKLSIRQVISVNSNKPVRYK